MTENKRTVERYMDGFRKSGHERILSCLTEVAGRGRGRIRQGYDSGEVVGYEVEGEDGTLFMALESELRRAETGND